MFDNLTRSIVALVTSMQDTGDIDYAALEKLVDYQINQGTSALVILGSTGETATLTLEERWQVVQNSVHFAVGRLPIIIGNGSNSTAEAITWTQQLEKSDIAACLTITPYYNRPTQMGLKTKT